MMHTSIMATPRKQRPLSAMLREELRAATQTESLRSVGRRAGMLESTLSRFLSGKQLMSDAVDQLVRFFDLEVRPRPARRRRADR